MSTHTSYFDRHPLAKDTLGVIVFIASVIIGTILINTFLFRSFAVLGPSMESTFYTGDRLIVNRLPITGAQLQNKSYIPDRMQIIVFKNPNFIEGSPDEYIVKRVIAFPGERVTVADGVLKVYNNEHPDGFEPDKTVTGDDHPGSPTSGSVDMVVPDGSIFVSGDHREGDFSLDSRNGLGTIPLFDIVGPVTMRIFPFNKIHTY